MLNSQVGAGKAAKTILGSLDRKLSEPADFLVRYSGIALFAFLIYIHLFFNQLGGSEQSVTAWFAVYLIYLSTISIIYYTNKRFYDTTVFRLARNLSYIVLGSWLMAVSPDSRFFVFLFFTQPMAAAFVYFREHFWLVGSVIGVSITGLFLGGVIFAQGEPLTGLQFVSQVVILLGLILSLWRLVSLAEGKISDLTEFTRVLYQTLDLGKLLENILTISLEITSADRAMVIIVDPEQRRYILHDSRGYRLLPGLSIEKLADKCYVLRKGEPFRSADFKRDFHDRSIYKEFFGIQPASILVEPIFSRENRVLGVINVSHDRPNQLSKITAEQFEQFSYLAGNAVENCLQHRQALLRESNQREVNERLALAGHEDEVVEILVDEATRLFPKADGCVFHRFEPTTTELNAVKASYTEASNLKKTVMRIGEGIAGHALQLREPINVGDLKRHPWYQSTGQEAEFNSILVAPLVDPEENEAIGTISLHSRHIEAFNTENEASLFSLANQGARAVARIYAFDRWRLRGGTIRSIMDEFNQIDIDLDEKALCLQLAQSATRVLGFHVARMRLVDALTDDLVTVAITGLPPESVESYRGHRMPREVLGPFLVEQYRAEQSYLIPHDSLEWQALCDRYMYVPPEEDQQKSWRKYDALLTPLVNQSGQMIGLLTLDLPINATYPTPEVIEAVGVFASAATLVLELSRERTRLIEHQKRTMAFIETIGIKLAATHDLQAIGNIVVQIGANLLSAEGCSLYLVEGDETRLAYSNFLAGTTFIGRRKPITHQPGCGFTAYVAATGECLRFNDLSYRDHPAWGGEKSQLKYIPSRACNTLLIVPIRVDEQAPIIGVLKLENKRSSTGEDVFSDHDLENLEYLATHAALAIQLARQYSSIEKWERIGLEDDLHELVNWFHAGVIAPIEVSQVELEANELESAREKLELAIHHALTTVEELKGIHTAVTSRYLEFDDIFDSLRLMVEAWTTRLSGVGLQIPVQLNCPKGLYLPAPVKNTLLRIAVSALSNAIKYSGVKENPEKTQIEICLESFTNSVMLQVKDTGIGMAKVVPGYGINRMQQLAMILNREGYPTDYQIITQPGKGTTVSVNTQFQGDIKSEEGNHG